MKVSRADKVLTFTPFRLVLDVESKEDESMLIEMCKDYMNGRSTDSLAYKRGKVILEILFK